ncbi:sigma-54 dependent transcriptional regulator [Magnetovibrio sp. PR-2]|uniref:sigma-54-dependent transcriptional regulator n=1 Tax=Magnetovibrio sp. PR-2 TaxID=3120356 RepID=UPI002FCE4855
MNASQGDGLRALIVDDDAEMRDSLVHLLTKAKWQVLDRERGEDVHDAISAFNPDVILCDVRMSGMSGMDVLKSLSDMNSPPVVLISAHGDIPMAVDAMRLGAYTFLEKPFDPRRLLTVLKHAGEKYRLQVSSGLLKQRLADLSGLDRILLGDAQQITELRAEVMDLSETDASVMVLGETGTGKGLVAQALHDLSPRTAAPFIAIDCATVPFEHFEEMLFGVSKGDMGALARADGGSLFLDEVASFPLEVQAKLLRVIETREYFPLGATEPIHANVRVLSATNEDMRTAVSEGRFREDLYHRLNTVMLTIPPLRERRDDVTLLYAHFISQYADLYEISAPQTSAEDVATLLSHDWPGNVRELRNVAERRVLTARRGQGSVAQALDTDAAPDDVPETLREAVAGFERQLIAKAIQTHKGRMDAVAEALGIGRRTLNDKIVKLGLNKEELI